MLRPHTSRILGKLLAWSVALAVLAAVFMMYLEPGFLMTLGNQIWACF